MLYPKLCYKESWYKEVVVYKLSPSIVSIKDPPVSCSTVLSHKEQSQQLLKFSLWICYNSEDKINLLICASNKDSNQPVHLCSLIRVSFVSLRNFAFLAIQNAPHIASDKRGIHIIFFLFLHENICCGYSLEAPRLGASNEYPQHVFVEK